MGVDFWLFNAHECISLDANRDARNRVINKKLIFTYIHNLNPILWYLIIL